MQIRFFAIILHSKTSPVFNFDVMVFQSEGVPGFHCKLQNLPLRSNFKMTHAFARVGASSLSVRPFCVPIGIARQRLPVRQRSQTIVAAQGQPEQKAKKTGPVSGEYKNRLRDEYTGFGGAPNKPMGSNYFLWIIVVISVLAVVTYLAGAI